jgi:hypothetical protein
MTLSSYAEAGLRNITEQFKNMPNAYRPTFKEIQAQEKVEVIEGIKNILFAKVLVRMIKNNSLTGNQCPLIINLENLAEVI